MIKPALPSKIRSLWIELPGYLFFHSPSGVDKDERDQRLIGRKYTKKKLHSLLVNSATYSGTYLVTGFRGMGKTSLVRDVLHDILDKQEQQKKKPAERGKRESAPKQYLHIESSLAQDEINELSILKSVCRNVLNKFKEQYEEEAGTKIYKVFSRLLGLVSALGFCLLMAILIFDISVAFLGGKFEVYKKDIPLNPLEAVEMVWQILLILMGVLALALPLIILPRIEGAPHVLSKIINRKKGYQIIDRLQKLQVQIDAHITSESSEQVGPFQNFFNFSRRRQERREPLGARDIEKELTEIFKDIKEQHKYQFIIVFDELDKIDPHYNANVYDKERQEPIMQSKAISVEEKLRGRREAIEKLFSNMKHFLTVTEAKFIFIAGREMYDAALADTSNRDSFINSIFHEIIYVSSFLSESFREKSHDITLLSEEYLCNFLLSEKELEDFKLKTNENYIPNLKHYYDFLMHCRSQPPQIARKVMYTLQNFVVYLTYRSNGAPKKITSLFEKVLRSMERDEYDKKFDESHFILQTKKWESGTRYFLHFDGEGQYRMNLISVLFTPFLTSKGRYMRNHGDKLLIASTYILDHLYKFHSSAFSWANLELTPEIIAINKAPELRGFIKEMVNELEIHQVIRISSGLFDFKFNKLVAKEIDYLSKTDQEESAAFNFTLDESLEIKRHYAKKLEVLKREVKDQMKGRTEGYFYSIGFIHAILGDLHYYDQEYDEAVIQYKDSVESLMAMDEEQLIAHKDNLITYVKTSLKLGLTYEKMNHYNLAYAVYRSVSEKLLAFSEARLNHTHRFRKYYGKNSGYGNLLMQGDTETTAYLRITYQPLLARLVLFEKTGLNSIVQNDIELLEKEFNFLFEKSEALEKNVLIESQFNSKIGDVLYFKNSFFIKDEDSIYRSNFHNKLRGQGEPDTLNNDFRAPLSALKKYLKAIGVIEKKLLPSQIPYLRQREEDAIIDRFKNSFMAMLDFLLRDAQELKRPLKKKTLMVSIAGLFCKIGDTLVCCHTAERKLDVEQLLEIKRLTEKEFTFHEGGMKLVDELIDQIDCCLTLAICCYRLAAKYYGKSNDIGNRAFQLQKILYLIKECLAIPEVNIKGSKKALANACREKLMESLLTADYQAEHAAGRIEILRYEDILDMDYQDPNYEDEYKEVLNATGTSSQVIRDIVLMKEIELKVYPNSIPQDYLHGNMVINNQYNRLSQLYYQLHINYKNFLQKTAHYGLYTHFREKFCRQHPDPKLFPILGPDLGSSMPPDDDAMETLYDSLYCCQQAIKIVKTFGTSPVVGYSMQAYLHERMADWSLALKVIINMAGNQKDELWDKVAFTIGKNPRQYLSYNYHYEMAMSYFQDVINAHSEGDSYKKLIGDMYYLEDDFSDTQYMFGAALERLQVNTGCISRRIREVKAKVRTTTAVYSYEKY